MMFLSQASSRLRCRSLLRVGEHRASIHCGERQHIRQFSKSFPFPSQHPNNNEEAQKQKSYIDDWFASTRKPQEFYDMYATQSLKEKKYFYSIDLQGRTFLEEVIPKNIATSLKDTKVLDMLVGQMREVNEGEIIFLNEQGIANDYPYVSPCGIEKNFIRPADSPIVFHELQTKGETEKEIMFGGTLRQPFCPLSLAISPLSGRLYHRLISDISSGTIRKKYPTKLHKSCDTAGSLPKYGLIKSSIAVSLAENFVESNGASSTSSGLDYVCPNSGSIYPIEALPSHAEPGSWAFPYSDDGERIR